MQIRGSPNGARHGPPHLSPPDRHRSERVVVINWNGWSPSIGIGGRHQSVRPHFIKDRMLTKDEGATKDDLQQFERRLDARFDTLESRVGNIETELRDIRQRLEALDQAAGNASGFTKEIDHLLKRLAAIEKHLGLQTHIKA